MSSTTVTVESATRSFRIALRAYTLMASRPRARHVWAWVQCLLWNARQDALAAGIITRRRPDGSPTDDYELISSRYRDASARVEQFQLAERMSRVRAPAGWASVDDTRPMRRMQRV